LGALEAYVLVKKIYWFLLKPLYIKAHKRANITNRHWTNQAIFGKKSAKFHELWLNATNKKDIETKKIPQEQLQQSTWQHLCLHILLAQW
jgi:hypothetical protein